MCGWVEVLGGQWPKVLQGSLSHWGPPINMSRQAGAFAVQKRSITITTQWAPNERSHGGGGCFWAKNGITEHRSKKHCTTVDLCEKNVSQPTVCVCHIIWQQERQEREAGTGVSDRKEAGDETRTCIRLVLYREEHVFIWFFLREILMDKYNIGKTLKKCCCCFVFFLLTLLSITNTENKTWKLHFN